MITKLEVDGFKSFSNFTVDFSPFTVIVGANASGKSNIFDALMLLSRLATMPVAQALAEGRGEPAEQFRRHGGTVTSRMTLAVELLLDPVVVDAFGAREELPHTRLRYSITVEERPGPDGITRPWVENESIVPIKKRDDGLGRRVSADFASRYLRYGASGWKKVLVTEGEGPEKRFTFTPRRSGGNQGHPRHLPAGHATASVLTSVGSVDVSPLLFAVRREMERWRVLQLDPAALRQPSPTGQVGDRLRRDGANLAWVLRVIEQAAAAGSPGLPALAADLTRVIRGFSRVRVSENRARRQWEVDLESEEGDPSARVASDGTLRLLAVLAALYEPSGPGVVCFEEPENGIQPARLGPLLEVLRDLVTDLGSSVDEPYPGDVAGDEVLPLVQLLVSSHAPKLAVTSDVEELVVIDSIAQVGGGGVSRITRARTVLSAGEDPTERDTQLVLPFSVRAELTGLSKVEAQAVVDAR